MVVIDAVFDIFSKMDEKLQIECIDVLTGRAVTSLVPFDAGKLVLKGGVRILDQFEQCFPAQDLFFGRRFEPYLGVGVIFQPGIRAGRL
jgi:hypothetical protein